MIKRASSDCRVDYLLVHVPYVHVHEYAILEYYHVLIYM